MALLRPLRPVRRRFPVTNSFGRKGNYAAGYHTGIDYATPIGTPVRAPRAGIVLESGWNNDYGNYVLLQGFADGKGYLMAHLSTRAVRKGQRVIRGQRLGRTGNTGNSTGPHLHAEQRKFPYGYWEHERPGW
jgi:murein DD-endopeptidase MepM/ murein hydrolase activator NlpD